MKAPMNPWSCFSNNGQNPLDSWIVPGSIDLLSVCLYVGLLIIFAILGVILRRQLRKKKRNQE
jgi:hypothetical protein